MDNPPRDISYFSENTPAPQDWSRSDIENDGLLLSDYVISLNRVLSWNAKDEPLQFAIPGIRAMLNDRWKVYRHRRDPRVFRTSKVHSALSHSLQFENEELYDFISELSTYKGSSACRLGLAERQLEPLIGDARTLLAHQERAMKFYLRSIDELYRNRQNDVLAEQLQEAEESREAALSVGRLTKLAFIYIPLSFVCTLFGMNLQIFGQGTVPL